MEAMSALPSWQRLLLLTMGGLMAGFVLQWGTRWKRQESTTDYMEAIALGDGNIPIRASLMKSLSALVSIASGASIGREGPLVQLAAMAASTLGRLWKSGMAQRRLLVACGAAAGIASAYNAPLTGAMFVAEVVLGTLAFETLGPLLFSSVVATATVRHVFGEAALYQVEVLNAGGATAFRRTLGWGSQQGQSDRCFSLSCAGAPACL
ncbi:chloride channel protein [Verrucomicrobium spinosum]|uniref:chloride channel protein n=1 Tax=Verrucomicrobium spinosum TaxID=2736 RepID=UPI00155DC5FC|nr:chloride channel protein [Verrucomicrobium spinosum]